MTKVLPSSGIKKSYSLFHDDSAGARRPAALLFHGMSGSTEEMLPLGKALHARGFDVSIPLLSGHSDGIEEMKRTSARVWEADTEKALQEILSRRPQQLAVVGLSFGAILSLRLAAAHPEDIAALVLLAAPIVLRSKSQQFALRLLSFLPDPLLNQFGVVPKHPRPSVKFIVDRLDFDAHSIAGGARLEQVRRSAMRSADKVRCPVLALQDPNDHHVSVEALAALRVKLVNCSFTSVEIPGGEHELPIGPKHVEVEQAIWRFFEQVLKLIG